MIICDICKRERPCSKITIPYTFSCKAFQTKTVDMCEHCARILDARRAIVTIGFIDNLTEDEALKKLYWELPKHTNGENE